MALLTHERTGDQTSWIFQEVPTAKQMKEGIFSIFLSFIPQICETMHCPLLFQNNVNFLFMYSKLYLNQEAMSHYIYFSYTQKITDLSRYQKSLEDKIWRLDLQDGILQITFQLHGNFRRKTHQRQEQNPNSFQKHTTYKIHLT